MSISQIIKNTNKLILKKKYLLLSLLVFNISTILIQLITNSLALENFQIIIILIGLSLIFLYSGILFMQKNALLNPTESSIEDFIYGLKSFTLKIFLYILSLIIIISISSMIIILPLIFNHNISSLFIGYGIIGILILLFSIGSFYTLQILAYNNEKVIKSIKLSFKFVKKNFLNTLSIVLIQSFPIIFLVLYFFNSINLSNLNSINTGITVLVYL